MSTDDYTQDLREELARYALPNPYRHTRSWRLLFVSSDGRVVQSGNYRQVVTTTLVILVLLSLALAATTGLWLHTKSRLATAVALQDDLNATLARQTAAQESLMARLALAEEKAPQKPAEPVDATQAPMATMAPKAPPVALPPFVRVDTLEATRSKDGSSLKVTFKLFNDTPDKSLTKGTLFLVFTPKAGSEHAMRSLPAVMLTNGVPPDPSRGESFQMRNYKTRTFRLRTDAGDLPYSEVTLHVFDENGDSRYKKTFPL
ncbi:hypothetical protein DSLASN_29770 [Desulfoluna limicola]|uniref:Uncharacterized protein n=1 Tax=Desulfoluna limicola TaxID=2810562 RepID=A0ABM7PJR0_9BACT|nr:hypothetical protein [Desulfoluna limicola]BCS97345.1 hypothetical protein DSLASN_29770 [Desulfoluna limicola]